MAGGLIGMNLERGRQAQSTLLGLAAQEQQKNAANEQIKAAERAETGALMGTGAGIGAKIGLESAKTAAANAAAYNEALLATSNLAPALEGISVTANPAAAAAAGEAAAATTAATTAATGAGAAGTAGTAAGTAGTAAGAGASAGATALAVAPWVLGGMAVSYLLSELFD